MSSSSSNDLKIKYKKLVDNWTKASEVMEKLRTKEIEATNTEEALDFLMPAFLHAQLNLPLRKTSGLVEQQKLFLKLYEKQTR